MPRSVALIALVALVACGCGGHVRHATPHRATAPASQAAAHVRVPESCTNVWIGPRRGGLWSDRSNWSGHRVPGPTDQACLDRGTTVDAPNERVRAGSIIDGGTLAVVGGSLILIDSGTVSEIGTLGLERATLTGPGPLEITHRFVLAVGAALARPPHSTFAGPAAHSVVDRTVKLDVDDGGEWPPRAGTGALGTGWQPAPRTACGPHSPQGIVACSSDDTPLSRGARDVWRRFAIDVNALSGTGRDDWRSQFAGAARLLSPRLCDATFKGVVDPSLDPAVAATCARLAMVVSDRAAAHPLVPELGDMIVIGQRAYGYAHADGNVRLVRRRGRWVITALLGAYEPPGRRAR
jgi:hypothetical protein